MKHALYRDFNHIDADILQKCISIQETKQSSKFQSDPSSNQSTLKEYYEIVKRSPPSIEILTT